MGTASPAAPRPGPCTRPRTGRSRGHPAGSRAARGRVKGAARSFGPALWAALDPAAGVAGRGPHAAPGWATARRPAATKPELSLIPPESAWPGAALGDMPTALPPLRNDRPACGQSARRSCQRLAAPRRCCARARRRGCWLGCSRSPVRQDKTGFRVSQTSETGLSAQGRDNSTNHGSAWTRLRLRCAGCCRLPAHRGFSD